VVPEISGLGQQFGSTAGFAWRLDRPMPALFGRERFDRIFEYCCITGFSAYLCKWWRLFLFSQQIG
jgi:hypothetical protein